MIATTRRKKIYKKFPTISNRNKTTQIQKIAINNNNNNL